MSFAIEAVRARIEDLMEERGIKRKPLAKAAGLGETSIRDIFDERRRDVRVGTLVKLADYFGITLDDLIGRDAVHNHQPVTADRLKPVLGACLAVVEGKDWSDQNLTAIAEAVIVGLDFLPDQHVSDETLFVVGRVAAEHFRKTLS